MPYAVRTIARSRASARLRPLRSPSGLPPRPQPRLVSAWTYPILPYPKGCPIISCGGGLRLVSDDVSDDHKGVEPAWQERVLDGDCHQNRSASDEPLNVGVPNARRRSMSGVPATAPPVCASPRCRAGKYHNRLALDPVQSSRQPAKDEIAVARAFQE